MAAASPSRTHWFVLAVIGLMLLIPCCWLLVEMHELKMQREGVERIKEGGGSVGYLSGVFRGGLPAGLDGDLAARLERGCPRQERSLSGATSSGAALLTGEAGEEWLSYLGERRFSYWWSWVSPTGLDGGFGGTASTAGRADC